MYCTLYCTNVLWQVLLCTIVVISAVSTFNLQFIQHYVHIHIHVIGRCIVRVCHMTVMWSSTLGCCTQVREQCDEHSSVQMQWSIPTGSPTSWMSFTWSLPFVGEKGTCTLTCTVCTMCDICSWLLGNGVQTRTTLGKWKPPYSCTNVLLFVYHMRDLVVEYVNVY